MKKSSSGLTPEGVRADEGVNGSNALGLGARAGARAGSDEDSVCDVVPPDSPAREGVVLARAVGGRYPAAELVGCRFCETTFGGDVVVIGGSEEGTVGVEAEVEAPASLPAGVNPSPGVDVETTCPDSVATIVHAPLSGGAAAAMMPAMTSAGRRNLLTRAPSSSEISGVSGPWLLA
ncbi:MAG TPA: hypothetical protein VN845_11705 [Solirubrobacteraceae bacterium]|jgi:hypothetical protein|nr:hypothetical protein [Solirubrobacteraceae bacterium]